MYHYLLFDLDGTLTDSGEGITRCVQYALHCHGVEEPDLNKLRPFIGPPLVPAFMQFYGFDREQAESCLKKYRERFETVGMFENQVYEGIPEALKALKEKGNVLAVASSKPEKYVKKILEHFHLLEYFDEVVGASMDEKRSEKVDIITEAFQRLGIVGEKKDKVLMIGDREHDVEGARLCGLDCMGVYFGFAREGELEAVGAKYIVQTVKEMETVLLEVAGEE